MTVSEHIEAAQIVRERRAKREANRVYEQASLNAVLVDVRHHAPGIDTQFVSIWKRPHGKYEFRYMDFVWTGAANSAIEAKAAGWSAWLTKEGAEGYGDDPGVFTRECSTGDHAHCPDVSGNCCECSCHLGLGGTQK